MVLHAETFNNLDRKINRFARGRAPREWLLGCHQLDLVGIERARWWRWCGYVVLLFIWSHAIGWAGLVLSNWFLFFHLQVIWEDIKVNIAAIRADNGDALADLIELDPTYFVSSTVRLIDCIHSVHRRCLAYWVIMDHDRFALVSVIQISQH